MQIEINCNNQEETRFWGTRIGNRIPAGAVIAAYGDLGAGKTLFAAALAKGLGVTEQVVSPTFVYYQQYQGRLSFCHIDGYRLELYAFEEKQQLGLEDCFDGRQVVVAEWPQYIEEFLPKETICLSISRVGGENCRLLTFVFNEQIHPWLKEVLSWPRS